MKKKQVYYQPDFKDEDTLKTSDGDEFWKYYLL